MGIGLLLNSVNTPPKNETLVKRQIADLIKKYGNIEGKSWEINKDEGTVEMCDNKHQNFHFALCSPRMTFIIYILVCS